VNFEKLDYATKEFAWRLQIGNDDRISAASRFPGQGIRQMYQQAALDNAVLRFSNSSSASLAGSTITQGVRAFPGLFNVMFD
jgi:hypothetical protein